MNRTWRSQIEEQLEKHDETWDDIVSASYDPGLNPDFLDQDLKLVSRFDARYLNRFCFWRLSGFISQ